MKCPHIVINVVIYITGSCHIERDYNIGISGFSRQIIRDIKLDECARICQEAAYQCVSLDT